MKTLLAFLLLLGLDVGRNCRAQTADAPTLRCVGWSTLSYPPAADFVLDNPQAADVFYVATIHGNPVFRAQTRDDASEAWRELRSGPPDSPGWKAARVRALFAGQSTGFGYLHGGFRKQFRVGIQYFRTRTGLADDPAKWPEPEVTWSEAIENRDPHEAMFWIKPPPATWPTAKLTADRVAGPVSPGEWTDRAETLDARAFAAPFPAASLRSGSRFSLFRVLSLRGVD